MAFPIENKLVVGVASSALFDLKDSDRIYREEGVEAYREYQRTKVSEFLHPGPAFPLVERMLAFNGQAEDDRPVEVVLLSKNDPDTGQRVMNSIAAHGLQISRAAFVSGDNPFKYANAFNACLCLSANPNDVASAMEERIPAGCVLSGQYADLHADGELRVAFDFDGVIADDSAEEVFSKSGLLAFHKSEASQADVPLPAGPLGRFFSQLAGLQRFQERRSTRPVAPRLRIAIVTARNAPADGRVVTTLRHLGITVDQTFFLGGIEKRRVLEVFRPHIFFDDGRDPIRWTSFPRGIRCPDRWPTHRSDVRVASSRMSSKPARSAWCSTKARPSGRPRAISI